MSADLLNVDEAALDEAFDDGQKNILLSIVNDFDQGVDQAIDSGLKERLEKAGLTDQALRYIKRRTDYQTPRRDFDDKFDRTLHIWKNSGYLPSAPGHQFSYEDLMKADQKRLADYNAGKIKKEEFQDTQFSMEQPLLIPRIISQMVRDAIEPNIVLTSLLQRISFQIGTSLTFPALSAFVAQDIPEGGEYPEATMEFAGEVTATIGKSGIAVKMTEEMIRYSLFDVMNMHLRAAGRALVRHKEQKVANMISDNGTIQYNNLQATTSLFTTGRGNDGTFNGTLNIEDLFRMYATMGDEGYTPNALVMHPFGWLSFAMNPSLRNFGFMNNGQMFQGRNGAPGSAESFRVGGLNQQTHVEGPGELATTSSPVPNGFPAPLQIIISPFVPYRAATNTTDIWMVDTNELGVLVVDEEVQTDEFNDPARDIKKVKLRERYAVENINNGKGIRIAKGVVIDRDFAIDEKLTWESGTGSLPTATGTGFPTS